MTTTAARPRRPLAESVARAWLMQVPFAAAPDGVLAGRAA
jgi:hypothetical protein